MLYTGKYLQNQIVITVSNTLAFSQGLFIAGVLRFGYPFAKSSPSTPLHQTISRFPTIARNLQIGQLSDL
jgi:hypothetical protein